MEELLDSISHRLDPEVEAAVAVEEAEAEASVEAEAAASVIEVAEVEASAAVAAEVAVIEAAEAVASVEAVVEAEVPQEVEYNSKERGKCSEHDDALGECYNNLTPCFFGWLFGWLIVLTGPYGTARKIVPNVPV